jgi:inorganic pyrophosphatase
MSYPYDWGFIPGTRAEDGDPLDAMVLSEGGTCAGAVWACRPIGALRLLQPSSDQKQRVHNDRVLAVPTHEARLSDLRDIRDLSSRERAELEQFFLAIVALDKPGVELAGWQGPDAATDLIRRLSQ